MRADGKLTAALCERITGDPSDLGLRLDGDGNPVESFPDPTGQVHFVTTARPHEGALYLVSIQNDASTGAVRSDRRRTGVVRLTRFDSNRSP